MPILRFVALTALGSAIWNAALIGAGVVVGDNWRTVTEIVSTYSTIALVTFALALVAAVVVWRRRVSARQ
jgi:membrane protein DedA with SNARE-associated domain